ncbi:hypothetical protein [Methylobacterium sp. D54C]
MYSMSMPRASLVAGARIRIRDAEWVIGHVERNSVSGVGDDPRVIFLVRQGNREAP